MQESGLVTEHPHTGAHGFEGVEAGGGVDDSMVGSRRQQQPHIHTPQDRQAQRCEHGFIGDEIRAGDPDPFRRRMDRFDKEQRTGFVGVCRPAGEQLAQHAVFRINLGQDQWRQGMSHPEPVFSERLLHARHHGSAHLHVGIAPRGQGRFLAHVFITDVVPANEAENAVHHHNFAMVTEVHLKAIEPAITGAKSLDLDPAITQGLHVAVG
ncbi:hypothetical protein D9M71_377270 [compost metagenome]